VSFDYVSCKDTDAKQTDDYRDRFDHSIDYSVHLENARVRIAGLCCTAVSSSPHNGFVPFQRLLRKPELGGIRLRLANGQATAPDKTGLPRSALQK